MTEYRKKLIEVTLPLEAINQGSKPETENPFLKNHPRAVHNWWARTPLSVCRAILFAQLIDDPGETLPVDEAKGVRQQLLDIVARLATWDAIANERLLATARHLIAKQFNGTPPEIWDMFAGRASIPLEAQRLGLEVMSSDLNPVAVTIQRALLEYPPQFWNRPPTHPTDHRKLLNRTEWKGTMGLAEDIRWYAEWIRERVANQMAKVYQRGPKGEAVIAWLWTRTVTCPNPSCGAKMPLVGSFWLAKDKTWIKPIVDKQAKTVCFQIENNGDGPPTPTKQKRKSTCLVCGTSNITDEILRQQAKQHGIGQQLMATVLETAQGRRYIPTSGNLELPDAPDTDWLEHDLPNNPRWFSPPMYGLTAYRDLFTARQLRTLKAFIDAIKEANDLVLQNSHGDQVYTNALITYLACALSRLTDYCCSLATWNPTNENVSHLFQRQAIPMVWDFAEVNPIEGKLSFAAAAEWVAGALTNVPSATRPARVVQLDATCAVPTFKVPPIISTDPPYYDNIGYADLSDYFYVWLRAVLRTHDPQTFSTVLTPKTQELIASPYHHDGSVEAAERHFREGFLKVFGILKKTASSEAPLTMYYAFRQEEEDGDENDQRASTGWETMLQALVDAGFAITATWPVRTTKKARSIARGTNALASAIVLSIRQRSSAAGVAARREFTTALKRDLPEALKKLQEGSLAPVDLAQAAIGPGMAVFTRYGRVLEADGSSMRVRTALALINQTLDEVLAEQESEFDPDTRWALAWFEQFGMGEESFGVAETLSKAKNTAVNGLVDAGIIAAKSGKVRLLKRNELSATWDPVTDRRLTVWEVTQQLIRALENDGEPGAANLLRKLGSLGDVARDLAYRLYRLCERNKWSQEALAYNSLVIAWPEILRLARSERPPEHQAKLDL